MLLHEFVIFLRRGIHGKNDFAEGFKILQDTDLKIMLLNHQNNFVGTLKIKSNAKNFVILATSLSVLHNYFDSSTEFFDLYSAKILDPSAKLIVLSVYIN